jgi:hypothetical protein
MPRYRTYFSPYFNSAGFQESDERKIEKNIEDKCKSILCLITKIWRHPSTPLDAPIDTNKDENLLQKPKD